MTLTLGVCLLIVEIAERENTTTTEALAKNAGKLLGKAYEGAQYPVCVQLLSTCEVQVSRLNTDTYQT